MVYKCLKPIIFLTTQHAGCYWLRKLYSHKMIKLLFHILKYMYKLFWYEKILLTIIKVDILFSEKSTMICVMLGFSTNLLSSFLYMHNNFYIWILKFNRRFQTIFYFIYILYPVKYAGVQKTHHNAIFLFPFPYYV